MPLCRLITYPCFKTSGYLTDIFWWKWKPDNEVVFRANFVQNIVFFRESYGFMLAVTHMAIRHA